MSTTTDLFMIANIGATIIVLATQHLLCATWLGWYLPLIALSSTLPLSLAIQTVCTLTSQESNTIIATTFLITLSSILLYCLPFLSPSHAIAALSIATLLAIRYTTSQPPYLVSDKNPTSQQLPKNLDAPQEQEYDFEYVDAFNLTNVVRDKNPLANPKHLWSSKHTQSPPPSPEKSRKIS
jgi:hypothetical protein